MNKFLAGNQLNQITAFNNQDLLDQDSTPLTLWSMLLCQLDYKIVSIVGYPFCISSFEM